MSNPKEELEPLFDYTRVQPNIVFCFDDTDIEKSDIFVHCKRRKVSTAKGKENEEKVDVVVMDGNVAAGRKTKNEAEEDWLLPPPPPKTLSESKVDEDKTLQELRMKKQELASLAKSAEDVFKDLMETAKRELSKKKPVEQVILDQPSEPQIAREKIVISIQDKDGQKQFRVYKDDKFEKLFKTYAKMAKLKPEDMIFSFDGEKVNPTKTPNDLGLEDDDMIEVHEKTH